MKNQKRTQNFYKEVPTSIKDILQQLSRSPLLQVKPQQMDLETERRDEK